MTSNSWHDTSTEKNLEPDLVKQEPESDLVKQEPESDLVKQEPESDVVKQKPEDEYGMCSCGHGKGTHNTESNT